VKSLMVRTMVRTLLAGTAAVMLCSLPAMAAKLAMPQVSGHVTAITANISITVDGKQYAIAAGSPAASSVRDVHVGDQVGLMMDGPAGRSGSHVTAIQKQSAP
jgi:hypothetical protein